MFLDHETENLFVLSFLGFDYKIYVQNIFYDCIFSYILPFLKKFDKPRSLISFQAMQNSNYKSSYLNIPHLSNQSEHKSALLNFSAVFDWLNLDFLFDFALVCSNHLFAMPFR